MFFEFFVERFFYSEFEFFLDIRSKKVLKK